MKKKLAQGYVSAAAFSNLYNFTKAGTLEVALQFLNKPCVPPRAGLNFVVRRACTKRVALHTTQLILSDLFILSTIV